MGVVDSSTSLQTSDGYVKNGCYGKKVQSQLLTCVYEANIVLSAHKSWCHMETEQLDLPKCCAI